MSEPRSPIRFAPYRPSIAPHAGPTPMPSVLALCDGDGFVDLRPKPEGYPRQPPVIDRPYREGADDAVEAP